MVIFLHILRMTMFYDQFMHLCERDGVSPTSLLKNLGMSKGSLSNWREGKLPTGEILVRFSEHFQVSLDYLVNGTDVIGALSEEDREWLDLIHSLSPETQRDFKGAMRLHADLHEIADREEQLRQAK